VEDQSTDTGDLTDTADARNDAADVAAKPAPARGVPVGKRSGRHRYFRPRPVAATPEATSDAPEATSDASEDADTVVAQREETSAASEITETAAAEPATVVTAGGEVTPKPQRRRWFGRRSAASAVVAPTEATESAEADTEPAEPDKEVVEFADEEAELKRAPKPAGKRMAIVVVVAAVLFVAAGAFGGAMLQPYLTDRAVAETKLAIARTATDAITTLFTYTPDDMDQLPARTSKYLGGDLRDAYTKQVDALAATNKQNQISRNAQVVGAAVESLNGPEATAVVYANITYTSAATKDIPKIFLVSYRLTMKREGSDWVITSMPWITSKDLTRVMP